MKILVLRMHPSIPGRPTEVREVPDEYEPKPGEQVVSVAALQGMLRSTNKEWDKHTRKDPAKVADWKIDQLEVIEEEEGKATKSGFAYDGHELYFEDRDSLVRITSFPTKIRTQDPLSLYELSSSADRDAIVTALDQGLDTIRQTYLSRREDILSKTEIPK